MRGDQVTENLDKLSARVDQTTENVDKLSVRGDQVTENVYKLSARVDQTTENVNRVTANLDQLSLEMRELKNEMREESRQLSQRITEVLQEMREESRQLSQRITEVSEETSKHIAKVSDEMRADRRNLNKRISEMSHKMGTMAEDLVAPSVPRILAEVLNCTEEPEMEGVRIKRRLPDGRSQEYDVVAVCGDYLLICEVKSTLKSEDVRPLRQKLETAREFLPEFAHKKVIGALATFYIEPSYLKHGERLGFIMLGVIDGLMQVLNKEGFVPKAY